MMLKAAAEVQLGSMRTTLGFPRQPQRT
ncbi:hypothetical protein cypCar_00009049, partial [Cyprinus carpio]